MPALPSPAVVRAGDLLHHLAQHPTERFSVSELARVVSVPRATCGTLLLGLLERGFVRRDASLRYGLGPACFVIADAARAAIPAIRAAADEAEALARRQSCCTAVAIRDRAETRVVAVFDNGPPIGFRARAGESIQLVAPFGAAFVAWGDANDVQAWLEQADPPLSPDELDLYVNALDAVRNRGYSVTVMTDRQPDLIDALERLVEDHRDTDSLRARDEVVRQFAHSDYLTRDLDFVGRVHLVHVSAPVFDSDGVVGATIMLLGPTRELAAAEIRDLGRAVTAAAQRASASPGPHRFEPIRSPSVL